MLLTVKIATAAVVDIMYMQVRRPDRMPTFVTAFIDDLTLVLYVGFVVAIVWTAYHSFMFLQARKGGMMQGGTTYSDAAWSVGGGLIAIAVFYVAGSLMSGTFDIIQYINEQFLT